MMVKPSMVKPLGLSSERDEFKRRHVVTRLRSVTLLCRKIIAGSHFPLQLSAEHVAADIVSAVERGKKVVTIDWR